MDMLVERLDEKLREWEPSTAAEVRQRVSELIDLADEGLLETMRSRAVEQEVLDILDENVHSDRSKWQGMKCLC